MKIESTIHDTTKLIEFEDDRAFVRIDELNLPYELLALDEGRFVLRSGKKTFILDNVNLNGTEIEFTLNGKWVNAKVRDDQMLLLDKLGFKVGGTSGEGSLKAPMPGKILNLMVNVGDEVKPGDPVVILEAMKMENELKAASAGKVTSINAEIGQSVEKNHIILEIESLG